MRTQNDKRKERGGIGDPGRRGPQLKAITSVDVKGGWGRAASALLVTFEHVVAPRATARDIIDLVENWAKEH